MARLRRISGKEMIQVLEKLGFVQIRQRGSHVILRKELADGATGCVVPLHPELALGTLRAFCDRLAFHLMSLWSSSKPNA